MTEQVENGGRGTKIEKGVPMPSVRKYRSRYPWNELEVGDSFLIVDAANAYSAAAQASKRHAPKKFAARRDGNGARIWRVA